MEAEIFYINNEVVSLFDSLIKLRCGAIKAIEYAFYKDGEDKRTIFTVTAEPDKTQTVFVLTETVSADQKRIFKIKTPQEALVLINSIRERIKDEFNFVRTYLDSISVSLVSFLLARDIVVDTANLIEDTEKNLKLYEVSLSDEDAVQLNNRI